MNITNIEEYEQENALICKLLLGWHPCEHQRHRGKMHHLYPCQCRSGMLREENERNPRRWPFAFFDATDGGSLLLEVLAGYEEEPRFIYIPNPERYRPGKYACLLKSVTATAEPDISIWTALRAAALQYIEALRKDDK